MNLFMQGALVVLLPSLVIAFITAKLTVRYLMKHLYSDQWSDKKSEAYGKVIAHLCFLQSYFQERYDDSIKRTGDYERLVQRDYEQAKIVITHAASVGGHLVSEQTSDALISLLRTLRQAGSSVEAADYFEICYHLVQDCNRRVRKHAEADLKGVEKKPVGQVGHKDRLRPESYGREARVN